MFFHLDVSGSVLGGFMFPACSLSAEGWAGEQEAEEKCSAGRHFPGSLTLYIHPACVTSRLMVFPAGHPLLPQATMALGSAGLVKCVTQTGALGTSHHR